MYWILSGAAAIASVWFMLSKVAARGGEQSGDATQIIESATSQAAAFHGDEPEGREAWGGIRRPDADPVGFG